MKTLTAILVLWCIALFGFPAGAEASGLGEVRLSYIEGDVQIWDDEAAEWMPVSINMPIREADRIWVPDGGKAELQSRSGAYLRLNEETSLEILRIDRDSLQVYLSEGQAYLYFSDRRDSMVQVDTPVSSVRAYDRTKCRIDVDRWGQTDVSVLAGEVFVDSRSGSTLLRSGRRLSIGDEYADLSTPGRADAWERWNRERDRRLADRRSRYDYLPDELRGYGPDFDEYGRWVYVREYGYVWTPTVSISVGWAPYRNGRWIWRGGDYVWISYEPWGWTPYHYGRWSFVTSIGWCWVPPSRGAVYWGPGYVGWVSTPTYVAWVPLAPGEIYYGYGYYGPQSVNILNINISRTELRHVYRHARVKNAVTVIHHDTFVRGRQRDVNLRENPFLEHRPHIGRPAIKPERETYVSVMKDIPEVKRPPRIVREVKVKEIRESRPFVKEKARPVLNPEGFERSQREWRREREKFRDQDRDTDRRTGRTGIDQERDLRREREPRRDQRDELRQDREQFRERDSQPPAVIRQKGSEEEKGGPQDRDRERRDMRSEPPKDRDQQREREQIQQPGRQEREGGSEERRSRDDRMRGGQTPSLEQRPERREERSRDRGPAVPDVRDSRQGPKVREAEPARSPQAEQVPPERGRGPREVSPPRMEERKERVREAGPPETVQPRQEQRGDQQGRIDGEQRKDRREKQQEPQEETQEKGRGSESPYPGQDNLRDEERRMKRSPF